MSWNYRVVKRTQNVPHLGEAIISYGIHEVYYDKDGRIVGLSEQPVRIIGDLHVDLYDMIDRINKSFKKKTVVYETLEEIA